MPQLTIEIENQNIAKVTGAYGSVNKIIDNQTSYYATGYQRDWRYRTGRWDGKSHLFVDDVFPAGLTFRVVEELRATGHQVTVNGYGIKNPSHTPIQLNWEENPPLRAYQDEAAATSVIQHRGIIHMATATGKTYTIAKLIKLVSLKTLVIVPTKELLHQTAATLEERLKVHVSKFGDGESELGNVTVALFQALSRYVEDLGREISEFGMIISDEAHHTSAETWLNIMLYSTAHYRFGFTGTPITGKGEDLLVEAMAGPIIYTYDDAQGIADGYLTPPLIMITTPKVKSVDPKFTVNDYLKIYKEGIVNSEERNACLAESTARITSEWGKTLVVAKEIEHTINLAQRIAQLGSSVRVINGTLSAKERKIAMEAFRGKGADVLIATSIFDEGIDIPNISGVVLAGGGKAQYKVAQRIGRGMRKGGNDQLIVLDTWDTAHFILEQHSKSRVNLYRERGWECEWI